MKTFSCLLLFSPCAGFAQLKLSEAQQLSKTTNPILKAAQKDLEAVKAAKDKALSPFRPQLFLQSLGMSAEGRPGLTPMDRPDLALQFGNALLSGGGRFSWLFFKGGQDQTISRRADKEIEMRESRARSAWLDLLHEVRLEFSDGLLAQETLDGLTTSLQAASELERVTKERFEAGKVPEAFLFGAQADRLRVEQEVAEARADLEGAIARIVVCCGAETVGGRLGEWDISLVAPETLESSLDIAIKNSPRIAELKAESAAWRLTERLARQTGIPDLSFFAASDASIYRGLHMNGGSGLGLMMSWRVGDGGERRSEAAEAARRVEQFEALVVAERNAIRAEISTHWAQWIASPKILEAAEGRHRASLEAYRISKLRYEEGKAIRAEVSQSLADEEAAKTGLAKARAYQRMAWSHLMNAMGSI